MIGHSGTPPDKLSSRVSWWPEHKAPESVKAVCDRIWQDRDSRVTWWFGCCGVAENPDGFPMFLKPIKTARVGHYWFALTFERPGTRYQVTDIRDGWTMPVEMGRKG